jgi:hypothetical protein
LQSTRFAGGVAELLSLAAAYLRQEIIVIIGNDDRRKVSRLDVGAWHGSVDQDFVTQPDFLLIALDRKMGAHERKLPTGICNFNRSRLFRQIVNNISFLPKRMGV